MTAEREKLAARLRALRAKTVAAGCTEAEALAAAELLAKLLEQYNMTLEEAELRASPFARHDEAHEDEVGRRLWRVASAIATLIGCASWTGRAGTFPYEVHFFGFAHEIEVAEYMLEICAAAMRREQARILRGSARAFTARRRAQLLPFLDGMVDRLAARIRAMHTPQPTGRGLVVVRNALLAQAMADAGLALQDLRARPTRDLDAAYADGQRAADAVALNAGVRDGRDRLAGLLK